MSVPFWCVRQMYPTRFIEPEAVGYLVAEYVRCGKLSCKCRRGERHGPYWYLRFRRFESGAWRQRKRYVPTGRVMVIRAWLGRNKARDRASMTLVRQSRRLRAAVLARRNERMNDSELKGVCDGITGRDPKHLRRDGT